MQKQFHPLCSQPMYSYNIGHILWQVYLEMLGTGAYPLKDTDSLCVYHAFFLSSGNGSTYTSCKHKGWKCRPVFVSSLVLVKHPGTSRHDSVRKYKISLFAGMAIEISTCEHKQIGICSPTPVWSTSIPPTYFRPKKWQTGNIPTQTWSVHWQFHH